MNYLGCNELSCTGWGVCEAACNSVGVRRRTCTDFRCISTQQCTGPPCGKLGFISHANKCLNDLLNMNICSNSKITGPPCKFITRLTESRFPSSVIRMTF